MADLATIQIRLTLTPRASALLRDIVAAIRENNRWRYEEVKQEIENLETFFKVAD